MAFSVVLFSFIFVFVYCPESEFLLAFEVTYQHHHSPPGETAQPTGRY